MTDRGSRAWVKTGLKLAPLLMLVVVNVVSRLPPLLNAAGTHSDATIVALQARHVLDGEWSWFLWGAGYQGVTDVLLLAAAFRIFGDGPLVLMAVPLVTHLVAVGLAWDLLRRRLTVWRAAILCLPLALTPQAINGVVLYVPRQGAITLVFLAIYCFDRAPDGRRSWVWYVGGIAAAIGALYSDLFTLQMLAPVGFFGLLSLWDHGPQWRKILKNVAAMGVSLAVGIALLWSVRLTVGPKASPTALSVERIPRNFELLMDTALPWALSYKVFVPGALLYPSVWQPPAWFQWVQWTGVVVLAFGALAALAMVFVRRVPWSIRRLGLLGLSASAASLAGFLVSTMPSDMWSARYLAPIVWTAPFMLAPLGWWMRARGLAVYLTPYLASVAVAGWLSFGPYVDGLVPRLTARGQADEERQLATALRERGVQHGAAQFWLAYRLSYLWDENPSLVPLNPGEDRHLPFRHAYEAAPVVAWVFHPSEPRARPGPYEAQLRARGMQYEKIEVAGFTALIVRKQP